MGIFGQILLYSKNSTRKGRTSVPASRRHPIATRAECGLGPGQSRGGVLNTHGTRALAVAGGKLKQLPQTQRKIHPSAAQFNLQKLKYCAHNTTRSYLTTNALNNTGNKLDLNYASCWCLEESPLTIHIESIPYKYRMYLSCQQLLTWGF